MFWLALFLFIGSTALSMLMGGKSNTKASGLGDFQVPTADPTRVIPVVFGTVKLTGANVAWYGDLRTKSIKKGLLIKSTVGYKYYLGMQLSLCHGPIDALVGVYAGSAPDDKVVPYTVTSDATDKTVINMTGDSLFGGNDSEGGISGTISFYKGTTTQTADSYLLSKVSSPFPRYRGLCHASLNQIYVGNSAYIKNMSFAVRRCPDPLGLGTSKANINGDANAANMIYEVMTNTTWGLCRPATTIDSASFITAGNTLASEGMGLSMLIDSDTQADEFITDILSHIDGALYTDPATGLWTLKLARADYDPATLLEFGPESVIDEPDLSRASWGDTLNQMFIEFVERSSNYKTNQVKADESANFATQGETVSQTLTMHGFSNADTALLVAMRELKYHSYPIATLKMKLNRRAWALRIGSCFKFTWPAFGINSLVVRATEVNYGALEAGEIEVTAVEDVFSVNYAAYTSPSTTGWIDPITDPATPQAQLAIEAPHFVCGDERRILAACVRGDGTSFGAEVWTNEGNGYYNLENDLQNFCPSATLVSAYSRNTAAVDVTGFVIQGGRDLEDCTNTDDAGRIRGELLCLIDSEIMSVKTVTSNGDGTSTVAGIWRGVMDTLPADHLAGARVFFVSEGMGYAYPDALPADVSARPFKLLPYNTRGTVIIGNVSAVTCSTSSRYSKPLPPGNVTINGDIWPNGKTYSNADVALTLAGRNRVTQRNNNALVAQSDSTNQTPEGTYTIDVLVNGAVKRTVTGITATSWVYSKTLFATDGITSATVPVSFRITPVNGSLSGTARTTDVFYITIV